MIIKILPILLAIFFTLLNFKFSNESLDLNQATTTVESSHNHLTRDSSDRMDVLSISEASSKNMKISRIRSDKTILRLTWKVVPYAVKYKITFEGQTVVSYTTGIELFVNSVNSDFHITALDFYGEVVDDDVQIVTAETNPESPRTTTEFDKMSESPLYLVYSWIPVADANRYEVQLLKDDKVIRDYITNFQPQDDDFDLYEKKPVIEKGNYFWRVRGLLDGTPITEWSEANIGNSFKVTTPMRFCALGDSITHGGGSISVPPSTAVYNWETYCQYPIKNLGKSGDTTAQMLARFDNDVLPFHPEVLFIMAGVNDYRGDTLGWSSVNNLKAIKSKCELYGIKPVFITPTPINSRLIRKIKFVELPPSDWKTHRDYICDWVCSQEFYIDLTDALSDWEGNLSEDLSVDGLHPDAEGKRIIGQAVEDWIDNHVMIMHPDIFEEN